MAVSDAFAEHVRELLSDLGAIRTRKMFGGAGVYLDDLMFGLVDDETLYVKADAETRPAWEAAGSEPFSFTSKDGRREITSYWRLPASALDDPAEALRWARLGLEAALRGRRGRKPSVPAAVADLGPGPWNE